jgi:ribosome assembly protein YihI (activator of Der GTPase)
VLNDLKAVLQESAAKVQTATTPVKEPEGNEEFREQRRRKRNSSDDPAKESKKAAMRTTRIKDPRLRSQQEIPTRNFFASLRATEMGFEGNQDEYPSDTTEHEQQ